MSNVLERSSKRHSRVTLQSLRREIMELRQRVEDLEDLRELNQAIERNGAKPLIPWTKAKKDLTLS
jgi:hypothetical protein